MSGIRIHHAVLRDAILLVPHPGEFRKGLKKYNKGRKPKDYRILLDSDGNCIVSEQVWNRLKEVNAPFIVLNEVKNPPSQSLGLLEGEYREPSKFRLEEGIAKEFAPASTRVVVTKNG